MNLFFLLAIFFIEKSFSQEVLTECGFCSELDSACYNERTYQRCNLNGFPAGPLIPCPAGQICSNGECQMPSALVTADCADQCLGSCELNADPNAGFICTGPITYKMCLGTREIDGICPSGQICNNLMVAEDDFPCINMSSASIPMCCTSSINITATFPTPTVTEAANSFCFALGRHGFRYPSISGDATCKSYVYCYLYAGRMRGQQYTCPGRTVFDCRTRACVVPTVPLQDCTFCNPQCFV